MLSSKTQRIGAHIITPMLYIAAITIVVSHLPVIRQHKALAQSLEQSQATEHRVARTLEDIQRGGTACGDGVCGGLESCTTCPVDCGKCTGTLRGFLGGGNKNDEEFIPEEPEYVCGDNECHIEEDCQSCPGDCGECSYSMMAQMRYRFRRAVRFARRFLADRLDFVGDIANGALAYIDERGEIMRQNALLRSDAADQLNDLLEEYSSIDRRFSAVDRRLLERVRDRENANVITLIPALHLRTKTQRIVRSDAKMITAETESLLSNTAIRAQLSDPAAVEFAAADGDLEALSAALPAPTRSVTAVKSDLDSIQAIAQEDAVLYDSFDAKTEFRRSVELVNEMNDLAANPSATAPSLEQRLDYLIARRHVIRHTVGNDDGSMRQKMQNIRSGIYAKTTRPLVNILNEMRTLRQSANFQEVDDALKAAVTNMHSGLKRVTSLFAFSSTPRAEAMEVLQETAQASALERVFTEDDIQGQREVVLRILDKEAGSLEEMIASLPPEQSAVYESAFLDWKESLLKAQNPRDLRESLDQFQTLAHEVQIAARKQRNIFFRFIYVLHDLFSIE